MRNRFYQVPHCTGFGTRKPGSQAAHRGVKAEGGWAAVCTEYSPVSLDSDESPYISAQLWDDDDLQNLALMADAVHEHGSLAGIELAHTGIHSQTADTRWPAIAPSQVASDYHPTIVPKAMELADIRRVQADWARAARQARSVGFDIVYVYGGHSYLLTQFLSPFYNKRTDAYGGSLENRARMWLETLEAVREAAGDDCAVAVRIGVDLTPGFDVDEALEFVRLADHLVDLWDVNVGSIAEWSHDSGSSRFFPEGYQLEWTGRVREATAKPIVGVSRLTNPDRMAEIVVERRLGSDRRCATVDRGSVPAGEDRAGPLRRGARVHGLERLHRQGRHAHAPRLPAERHGRRGVPPRLASGAFRARGEPRP